MSEAGVHRPHVGGIHGRSNDGSYSLVLAGGFEDEVVSDLSVSFILSAMIFYGHLLLVTASLFADQCQVVSYLFVCSNW